MSSELSPMTVRPSLILSCGQSSREIVECCKEECALLHPDLVNKYSVLTFIRLLEADQSISRYPEVEGISELRYPLREGLIQVLNHLFGVKLPDAESRFVIEGADDISGMRRVHLHIVADLGSSEGELFCHENWPALVEILSNYGGNNVIIYVSLFLLTGKFDDITINSDKIRKDILGITDSTKKIERNWPYPNPRIYLLSNRTAGGKLIRQRKELQDIVAVFLESFLLSDFSRPTPEKKLEFLWRTDDDRPYASFGIKQIGIPIVPLFKYSVDRVLENLLKEFLKSPQKVREFEKIDSSLGENSKFDESVPRVRGLKIPFMTTKSRLVGELNRSLSDWKERLNEWDREILQGSRKKVNNLRRKSEEHYRKIKETLHNEIKAAFKPAAGFIRTAQNAISAVYTYCKECSPKREPTKPDPTKYIHSVEKAKDHTIKALLKGSDGKVLLFYFTVCIVFQIYFVASILGGISRGRLIFFGSIGAICLVNMITVILIWIAPILKAREHYKQFLELADDCSLRLDQGWQKVLKTTTANWNARLSQRLANLVRNYESKLSLFVALLEKKANAAHRRYTEVDIVGKRLANGEEVPIEDRQIRVSGARKYIVDERNFKSLFEELFRHISFDTAELSFQNDLFFKAILDGFPYDAYLIIKAFVNQKCREVIVAQDHFELGGKDLRDRLRNVLKKEVKDTPVYFYEKPVALNIGEAVGGESLFASAAKPYEDLFQSIDLDPRPEVLVPVHSHNNFYVYRVRWGMPKEAIP